MVPQLVFTNLREKLMKQIETLHVAVGRLHQIEFKPCERCWLLVNSTIHTEPERLSALAAHVGTTHYRNPQVVEAIIRTFVEEMEKE